mgnify:CR=1
MGLLSSLRVSSSSLNIPSNSVSCDCNAGTAEASEFLAALDEVEARVLSKPPVPRRSRPWLGSPLPPIDISREGVLTPSSDGAMGSPLKIM